jgi:hypothetical protein
MSEFDRYVAASAQFTKQLQVFPLTTSDEIDDFCLQSGGDGADFADDGAVRVAAYSDGHWFVPVVFQGDNGRLYRYGVELNDEDPGEQFETTVDELLSLGDPSRW